MSYFVVHLSNLNSAGEDWVSQAAFDFGALGVSEVLAFEQPEGEEDVLTKIPERRAVDVYFQAPPAREFLSDLQARFPEAAVRVTAEQERDWLAEWKKSFQPFALVEGHWVVPSWCEAPSSARHKIWIDPGMAFGTGTHETTQLVAQALRELEDLSGSHSLLDVGTGTGILAILARQLGVRRIVATEIEAEARRVAKENFALNDCSDIAIDETQIEDLSEKFDVVIANIIDGVLVRIQKDLLARVKTGGRLILSGIIAEREKDFLQGFNSVAKWDKRLSKGDWLLYAVRL